MGKIIAILALGLVAACIVIGVAVWWSNHSAAKVAVKEQAAAASGQVAAAQAQAVQQAQQIVVSGQAHDTVELQVHQTNDQAIDASPGAAQAVDPALVRNFDMGLCRYPEYARDPACAALSSAP